MRERRRDAGCQQSGLWGARLVRAAARVLTACAGWLADVFRLARPTNCTICEPGRLDWIIIIGTPAASSRGSGDQGWFGRLLACSRHALAGWLVCLKKGF